MKGPPTMSRNDRELGMGAAIARRDFVYGASAVAGAAAFTGSAAFAAQSATYAPAAAATYPPLRTGMRGLHPGSFEPIHALAWAGVEPPAGESTGEGYEIGRASGRERVCQSV